MCRVIHSTDIPFTHCSSSGALLLSHPRVQDSCCTGGTLRWVVYSPRRSVSAEMSRSKTRESGDTAVAVPESSAAVINALVVDFI